MISVRRLPTVCTLAALLGALACAGRAAAEEPQGPAAPVASQAAQDAYDAAFQLMSDGRWSEAATAFRDVAAKYPGTSQATLALEMARLAESKTAAQPRLALQEPTLGASAAKAPSAPDRSGRAELAVTSTLFGIWSGLSLGILSDAKKATLGLMALGGGLGLAISLGVTHAGRISKGDASLLSTGIVFGALDGLMLAGMTDQDFDGGYALTYAGSAVGLLTGVLVASNTALSAGDVAVITSFGYLGTFLSGMALLALSNTQLSDGAAYGTVLAGNTVGLLLGAAVSRRVEVSRGRVHLCELGASLGGLVVGTMTSWESADERSAALLLSAGVVGGGLIAYALTRDLDAPQVAPGQVSLDPPAPLLVASDRRGTPPTLGVSFLRGAF